MEAWKIICLKVSKLLNPKLYIYVVRDFLCIPEFILILGGSNVLSWSLRMKVAIGAARGLCFLHEAKDQVIYRDFKAANILLDSGFNAKLSDFGLAKEGPTDDRSHVTTEVIGTQGYAAPEYLETGMSSWPH